MSTILNSTVFFLIAYFFVAVSYQLVSFLSANFIGINDPVMYFNCVDHHGFKDWSQIRVLLFFGLGIFVSLLTFIVSFFMLSSLSRKKIYFRLFMTWLVIISACFVFGEFVSGMFVYQGIVGVFAWYFFPESFIIILGILSVPILVFVGLATSAPFLKLAPDRTNLKSRASRFAFLSRIAVIPFLIGGTLIIFMLLPLPIETAVNMNIIKVACISIPLFACLVYGTRNRYVKSIKSIPKFEINWPNTVISLVSLTLIYIVLSTTGI